MGAHKNDVNECVWLMAGVVVLCIVLIGIGRIRSGNPARAAASRLTLQMCEDLAAASTAAKHALLTEDDQQCRLAAGQARAALAAVEERRQALEALLGKGTGEEEERTFRPFSQAVATLTQTEAAVLELVVQNASGRMDDVLMEQLFVNVLENAVKHTPAGTPITLSAQVQDQRVHIQVADQGPGLPPEELERIFERFYRVNRGAGADGYGLGLAICRLIAKVHGGEIAAKNVAGGGLRIDITLPV